MGALFTVSYWITLVTVIPGFITIAMVYGAVAFVNSDLQSAINLQISTTSEFVIIAIFIFVMVFTQMAGILLEEILIKKKWLGRKKIEPYSILPYDEYNELYIMLARLKEKDDAQGHLRRSVVQFFMTINTMVAITLGIVTLIILSCLLFIKQDAPVFSGPQFLNVIVYSGFMVILLLITYQVARIRFREMARSLWATRNVGDVNMAVIE